VAVRPRGRLLRILFVSELVNDDGFASVRYSRAIAGVQLQFVLNHRWNIYSLSGHVLLRPQVRRQPHRLRAPFLGPGGQRGVQFLHLVIFARLRVPLAHAKLLIDELTESLRVLLKL